MSIFSLEDFDRHIENLGSQLRFLNEALEATDHKAPDWLATDLVSLRNKSGRLQDDMQRFKEQLESEGYATKKSNKRLSLEGAKPPTVSADFESSPKPFTSPHPGLRTQQSPRPPPQDDSYVGQHIDVTEEVNRRLRESRLRRLMDSPSTSQKRKRDAFEDTTMNEQGQDEPEGDDNSGEKRTPTKKLRASGSFEPAKRKENGLARGNSDDHNGQRSDFKRRKLWPGMT